MFGVILFIMVATFTFLQIVVWPLKKLTPPGTVECAAATASFSRVSCPDGSSASVCRVVGRRRGELARFELDWRGVLDHA